MDSDIHMFMVNGQTTTPMLPSGLAAQGLLETVHLEQWVVDNPQVLGGDIRIVTTQYDKWSSEFGDSAKERLDILGLDSSGQLVVVELKRGSDSRIHLQAITYAALVAGFDKKTLAEVHADYLNRTGTHATEVSTADAEDLLDRHVEGEWDADVLTIPKIVLLAEDFTAQTYTTVKWLSDLTPNLSIEMRTINVFLQPSDTANGLPCVVFRRLYPTDDPAVRILTPGTASADTVVTKIAERKMRARSTYILHDNEVIPEGARLELSLRGVVNLPTVEKVEQWIAENPDRGYATWVRNRERPLQWTSDPGDSTWTPTGLARHIVERATNIHMDAIPGGDVWRYNGHTLYEIARQAETDPPIS